MWQRDSRRPGHSNTPENLRYSEAKSYGNSDVNMRTFSPRSDVPQQYSTEENLRDLNKRNMPQNTSDRIIAHGPSPHSSTLFSMDSYDRNGSSASSASHMVPHGSQHSMTAFPGLHSNVPIPNMGHQHMSQQNMEPPNMAPQNMRPTNMGQQNLGPPNAIQQNMGLRNMTQQNMGPPNMSNHNSLQQSNVPVFMNGPRMSIPPPGFNNMNIPPPGYDNRIPSNITPPPGSGPYSGLPPPDNRLMGGNIPPPINIDSSQHLAHLPPPMLSNHGGIPVPMLPLHPMSNQQGFPQDEKLLTQNEDSEIRMLDQAWLNQFIKERQLEPVKKEKGKPKVTENSNRSEKKFECSLYCL